MQDSMQLPSSEGQQQNHNQFQETITPQFHQVISPKGRRLSKGFNMNTVSHESLTFSNSTYNKNQFTQRSPPLFNFDYINNQNVNTLNFRSFDKKECTFGSNRGHAIVFDKIKEESYLSNFDDDKNSSSLLKEQIQLPCFLSNENSPNRFNIDHNNDSLNSENGQEAEESSYKILPNKKYLKVNPSSRKEVKENIMKSIHEKVEQKSLQSLKSNKSKKDSPDKQSNLSSSRNQQRSKSPLEARIKSPLQNVNENQIPALKQKIKELQYSLQVESISTEELRTKVSVLNQLLQEKFLQKNGINFKLFQNSAPSLNRQKNPSKNNQGKNLKDSKSYTNIDLYVQMKVLQKSKQQIQIEYQRVRAELVQKSKQLQNYAVKCQELSKKMGQKQKTKHETRTQTSFLSDQSKRNLGTGTQYSNEFSNNKLSTKINQLQQQRQTLMQYIENQKHQIHLKDQKLKQLTSKVSQQQAKMTETSSYVKLFQEKQKRFTEMQRPKLLTQIRDLTEKLDAQRQQIERLQMQNNLRQMQISQSLLRGDNFQSSPQRKYSPSPEGKFINRQNQSQNQNANYLKLVSPTLTEQKQSPPKQTTPTEQNQSHNQEQGQAPDAMSLIMLQEEELKILKNERDYFRQQYEKVKSFERQNYNLRLRNEDLQNEVSSLHQLIEVDDQITF